MTSARSQSSRAALAVVAALSAAAVTTAAQDLPPGAPPDADADADAFEERLVALGDWARPRTVLIYGVIGLGSGAVVASDGTVVTNAHVVAGARYAVVQWHDGRTTLMRRRGIDYGRDLAVLEPEAPLAEPVPCFDDGPARPDEGDWVVAIGYPGGLRGSFDATVSLGKVIGAAPADTAVSGVLSYADAIRHDCAIFSGNSGGPLIDLSGRLVGINGAVDVQQAASMAIPIELVRDRLERLADGRILLPGGQAVVPAESLVLRGLYEATDAIARRLPRQVAEGTRAALEAEAPPLPEAVRELWEPTDSGDALAEKARAGARQPGLDGLLAHGPDATVAFADGLLGTRVGPRHAVVKAARVGNRRILTLADGTEAAVVASSPPDDLALVEVPTGARPVEAAPHRPVGSVVFALGADGIHAAGIVSVAERPTRAGLAAQIQQGGLNEGVERLLEGFASLADRLGIEALQEVARQLEQAIEMRRGFAAGTPPRSHPAVLSTDAPIAPSRVGAPLIDRAGRLVGVSVGVAHHGTAYVVPLWRVRRAFAGRLGGERVPARVGSARLY